MQTLNLKLNAGASCELTNTARKTQFGDGYVQAFAIGINTQKKKWSGQKNGDMDTVIKPILAFLKEHKGATPFLWADPLGETSAYLCSDYSLSQVKGNHWQVSLTFEQVFI